MARERLAHTDDKISAIAMDGRYSHAIRFQQGATADNPTSIGFAVHTGIGF